jgi:Flp pilus assembly protein TadD
MTGVIILAIIGLCVGVIIWRRRRSWEAYMTPAAPETVSRSDLAHKAFAHGNSCLAAGQFPEAIASFNQTLEIEPKHPHVAGRLAEVERQQQAAQVKATV